jgi:hypothetical protein
MTPTTLMIAIAASALISLGTSAEVTAQRRGGGGSAGQGGGGHAVSRPSGAVRHAVPRTGSGLRHAVPRSSVPVRPHVLAPYRSYGYYGYSPYYRHYPGISLGFHYGYPGYYGYSLGYPWYGYPSYGYHRYGYPGYGYQTYGYGDSSGYVYGYPGSLTATPSRAFGRLRIQDAPGDAQVFVDGYYVGMVDEFDGVLEAGPHRIEIRAPGLDPVVFDVNVRPGQTITYRARMQPLRP